jgi:hypothetical protein
MTKAKQTLDRVSAYIDCCGGVAGVSIPPVAPQLATAVRATYKSFRKLVAYVLTDDAGLAIQTVKELGYFGLEWEAELVTLLTLAE